MTVTVQQTPEHRTFDGYRGTYAVCRDLITARRVALFQVVKLEDGATQYRTMDREPMPEHFDLADAIRFATAEMMMVEGRISQAA